MDNQENNKIWEKEGLLNYGMVCIERDDLKVQRAQLLNVIDDMKQEIVTRGVSEVQKKYLDQLYAENSFYRQQSKRLFAAFVSFTNQVRGDCIIGDDGIKLGCGWAFVTDLKAADEVIEKYREERNGAL